MFETSSDKRCVRLLLLRDRAPPFGTKSSVDGDAKFHSDTECCRPFLLFCLSHPVELAFDAKVVDVVEDAVESLRWTYLGDKEA